MMDVVNYFKIRPTKNATETRNGALRTLKCLRVVLNAVTGPLNKECSAQTNQLLTNIYRTISEKIETACMRGMFN